MLFWNLEDTIAAVASGNAASVRGIVRLSGSKAIEIAAELSRALPSSLAPSRVTGESAESHPSGVYQAIAQANGRSIATAEVDVWLGAILGWERGRVYLWPTERSYTGQPSVEFHLVGCLPLLEALIEQCRLHGARNAQPGEFTLRSFMSGRMDLTQAEAVLGVINARGDQELSVALSQLAGGLSKPLKELRTGLINVLAHLEAGLDFVEEDIEFISSEELRGNLIRTFEQVQQMLVQIHSRNISSSLPKVVLVGRPNAGKSSLLNALSTRSTAIVSDVRGTTRDYLSAHVQVGSVTVEIIDTAGLDCSIQSDIDMESQQQSWQQLKEARVVLMVTDGTEDGERELKFLGSLFQSNPAARWIVVINKSDCYSSEVVTKNWKDQLHSASFAAGVIGISNVSALTGAGLPRLREMIESEVQQLEFAEGMSLLPATASRCRESLKRCGDSLQAAIAMTEQRHLQEELIAAEIRLAMEELGWIAGEVYTDDLLDRIFSQFCIGK